MSDETLDAFVEATRHTFRAMVGVTLDVARRETGKGPEVGYDVSGIVGLSNMTDDGNQRGALVISFREDIARKVVGEILGTEEFPVLDQDVADGIGELVNVIAGRAKRGLERAGIVECHTTLPNVILGSQHRVFHQRSAERLAAEFSSGIGAFLLQVLLPPVAVGAH